MAKKQTHKSSRTTDDVFKMLEQGIEQFLSSDKWKQYLTFQSTFHDYSFNNCMAILSQRPNATYVAGFEAWKKGFNRHVKKGEKGIAILIPVFKKIKEEEREGLEPSRALVRFRIGYVYDYAQTEGDPLPDFSFTKKLEFDSALYERMRAGPFPIREVDDCGGANGYFSYSDHSITILSSMSTAHKARCIIHEYAHGLLHDPKNAKAECSRPQRSIRELEAESVSFIVSQHFGLETSEYAFGYISGWAGENAVQALKQSGARIQKAARKIIESMNINVLKDLFDPTELKQAI